MLMTEIGALSGHRGSAIETAQRFEFPPSSSMGHHHFPKSRLSRLLRGRMAQGLAMRGACDAAIT